MSCWKGLFTQLRSCAPCWEWCRTNTPPVPEGLPREGQGSLQAPEQQLPAAAWKPVFREDDPARGTTCRGSPHVTLPRRSTATQFSGDSWGHTGTHGRPVAKTEAPSRGSNVPSCPTRGQPAFLQWHRSRGRVVTVLAAADRQAGVNNVGEGRPLSERRGLRTETRPRLASSRQTRPGLAEGYTKPNNESQRP